MDRARILLRVFIRSASVYSGIIPLNTLKPSERAYKAGQVWRYDTRPGEEASLLYLARVDELTKTDYAYHIFLDSVALKNPYLASGIQDVLPHAPVSRETLDMSVRALVQEDVQMPDISEAYAAWRKGFDDGQAGVFIVPVKEILNLLEEAVAGQ